MNTSPENIGFIVLIILIAVGSFFLYKSKEKKDYYKTHFTHHVDYPSNPRKDVAWGYYTTYQNQINEVKDHVNLHWQNFWEGEDKAIQDIQQAADLGLKIVIDLSPYLIGPDKALLPNRDVLLKGFFAKLEERDLLSKITGFTPVDEPNLPQNQFDGLIPQAVESINKARAFFADSTKESKLFLIYYYMPPFNNIGLFDVVGFDNYHTGSGILAPKQQYEEFEKLLKPNQQTMLLIGGSYNEDPTSFINYALGHPRVWGCVVFLWANLPHPGIGVPVSVNDKVRDQYIAAGKDLRRLAKS